MSLRYVASSFYFLVACAGSVTSSLSLFASRLKMSSWETILFMFCWFIVDITVASLPPKPSV